MANPIPQPITSKQAAFLGRLITKHGKAGLREAKTAAGVPIEVTFLRLTRRQAAAVISHLVKRGRDAR